jgi:hypothetical protein
MINAVGEGTVRAVIDAVLTTDRKPDGKYPAGQRSRDLC